MSRGHKRCNFEIEDYISPPNEVFAAFLRVVNAAPGAVMVHCYAGLWALIAVSRRNKHLVC